MSGVSRPAGDAQPCVETGFVIVAVDSAMLVPEITRYRYRGTAIPAPWPTTG